MVAKLRKEITLLQAVVDQSLLGAESQASPSGAEPSSLLASKIRKKTEDLLGKIEAKRARVLGARRTQAPMDEAEILQEMASPSLQALSGPRVRVPEPGDSSQVRLEAENEILRAEAEALLRRQAALEALKAQRDGAP